jgi:hypothetical protein
LGLCIDLECRVASFCDSKTTSINCGLDLVGLDLRVDDVTLDVLAITITPNMVVAIVPVSILIVDDPISVVEGSTSKFALGHFWAPARQGIGNITAATHDEYGKAAPLNSAFVRIGY